MTPVTPESPNILERLVAQLPDPAAVVMVGAVPEAVVALAREVRGAGKKVRVEAVVPWSAVEPGGDPAARIEAAAREAGVAEVVAGRPGPSLLAASRWQEAADAVILAGGFDYWSALADLQAWRPKVKPGGWIGGPGYGLWSGVTRAVDELAGPPEVFPQAAFWRVRLEAGREFRPPKAWPKVGVVTPHFATDKEHFHVCLESVRRQTVPCIHYVVSDGHPPLWPDPAADVRALTIPGPHGDGGSAARAVGGTLAAADDCEAVAFLDADNWFEPDHVESLLNAHRATGAVICTSGRALYSMAGQLLGPCPEVDGENFVDTSCFLLTRAAFGLIAYWAAVPAGQGAVCDRFFWDQVKATNAPRAYTGRPTLAFRTQYAVHYRHFGQPVPAGAKVLFNDGTTTTVRRVGEKMDA